MDDEATYEDQHGQHWDIHNDHQDGHEEVQGPGLEGEPPTGMQAPATSLRKYRVFITATVTASAILDVEAQSEEAARADVRAQLDERGSEATEALAEAASQSVRQDELDDLDIGVEEDD